LLDPSKRGNRPGGYGIDFPTVANYSRVTPREVSDAPKKPFRRRLLTLLFTIPVAYLLVLGLIRVFESRLIFFPNYPGRLDGDWHPRGLNVEDVWLTASDGVKLHAWWIPVDKARFTFLAFHGNASNIANRAPTYEFRHGTDVNVFALECRVYGRSDGKPSESGFYRDAEAAYEYLVNSKGIDRKAIISFGQSLGTAVAIAGSTNQCRVSNWPELSALASPPLSSCRDIAAGKLLLNM